jgi:DNA-binding protein HU-beta
MAKKGGAPTKSEILASISKDTELSRKQVSGVFEALNTVIRKSLRGNGVVTVPGLLKLKVVKKPATKARKGVNPFTGEEMMFKAKPASKKVRALPPQGHGELRPRLSHQTAAKARKTAVFRAFSFVARLRSV